MSRAKDLTKNTLIITVGRISTQLITFLLLPLYTAVLSTEEYGTVDLITTMVQLLIPIISLMIDQGVFRYLLNCHTLNEQKKVITNAFGLLTTFNFCFIFIFFLIVPFVNMPYKFWVLLILIITSYSNLFLQIARGLKKINTYALGSFVCSVITIILNVLCIAFFKMGAVGMLLAAFIGNLVCCIFLIVKLNIMQYIFLKYIDQKIAINELRYTIPLVPNQLSLWVMNSSDRLIISIILGTASNGILAVSHKFPAIYMTFFNIFQLAWHETGAIHYFDEDRDEFFTGTLEKVITIFSFLCIFIILTMPLVFNLFVDESYNEAYNNIPIYLVASLFNVIVGLLGVVYVATKKTFEIAKTTFLAAIINIVVNLLLIRNIGLYAASISTLVGYLVTMIYRIIDTKKYLSIKYNCKKYILIALGLLVCTFIFYLKNKLISIVCLPIFLLVAFWFNKSIIFKIIRFVKEREK